MTPPATASLPILDDLTRLAEITSAILDGQEVKRIVSDQAMHYIANPHPEHKFLDGDHYDVDHAFFLRTKKLLLRIARLSDLDIGATLLVPVTGTDWLTVALHNGTCFRYYRSFGQMRMAAPPPVAQVFKTGEPLAVPPDEQDALATALGPIRDSLGDVVAVIELTASAGQDAQTWN